MHHVHDQTLMAHLGWGAAGEAAGPLRIEALRGPILLQRLTRGLSLRSVKGWRTTESHPEVDDSRQLQRQE